MVRLLYLQHCRGYIFYINPVRLRFEAAFDDLRDVGTVKPIAAEILFFLTTAGGTAAFGQAGLAARMNITLNPNDPAEVADVLISGLTSPTPT